MKTTQDQASSGHIYKGEKIAIQTRQDQVKYQSPTIDDLLLDLDKAYRFFFQTIQREPSDGDQKRLIIQCKEQVENGFQGAVGRKGVEIEESLFDEIYERFRDRQLQSYPLFYALARNFWCYEDAIGLIPGIVDAYSLFMCYAVFDYYDIQKVKEIEGSTFHYLKRLASEFEKRKDTTLYEALSQKGEIHPHHLLFSFLFHLYDNFGRIEWLERFCGALDTCEKAKTFEEACNNFAKSASDAASTDLAPLFRSWKWPTKRSFSPKRRNSQDIQIPSAKLKRLTKLDDEPTYQVVFSLKGFTPDSHSSVNVKYDRYTREEGHDWGSFTEEGPNFDESGKLTWKFIHRGAGMYNYEFEDSNECRATSHFRSNSAKYDNKPIDNE